jgi:hypothetical protein
MPKFITFTVEGTGNIPTDMLRYDQCWPYSTMDAVGMFREYGEPLLSRRQIRLCSIARVPTAARWESFGWRVVK